MRKPHDKPLPYGHDAGCSAPPRTADERARLLHARIYVGGGDVRPSVEEIAAVIREAEDAAVIREREACALEAERLARELGGTDLRAGAIECADAIRARGRASGSSRPSSPACEADRDHPR